MMPFDVARDLAASVEPLPAENRSLNHALGCVLTEPVNAQLDIPHAATSAMDGWALGARVGQSWEMRDEQAEGPATVLPSLGEGEAAAVVTGSPVPAGTVSVLRSEHSRVDGTALHAVDPTPDVIPGRNIRPVAAEARSGEMLCSAGSLLTPQRAAVAAVAGYDTLTVTPRPGVRLVLTGGEVITAGLPSKGQVRDVFGVALPPMIQAMGADVLDAHRLDDDAGALAELFKNTGDRGPSGAELIITTGGTAHSRADVLRPVLEQLGVEILVPSVDMRPGHPALLARFTRTGDSRNSGGTRVYVLGLPGNPLAGFAALTALGQPLIDALRGLKPQSAATTLTAGVALEGARRGVRLLPAQVRQGRVHPVDYVGAHMMRGLGEADVLAVVPPGGQAAGGPVECLAVPGSSQE